ncbi:MAG: single-stranded DNA-binding protein [Bacteroidales bacterium]|jgi:single-strand DNA-binding protein|nr:single-stranded DNA-binding protein [Bacteroidales bacterium]MDD3701029.1 single-stranded DNA-binding protein [Bacteroidales bacterium]MDY0370239.1 single-stranded DNA-binding protein [Bacteroidales bacterium]
MTTMRNSVQLIGRAGIDPEVKSFAKDRKYARFTLATNEFYYNDKGARVEETHWHKVVAFGKLAERIEKSVKKGQQLMVNGRLTTNSWEDKNGTKRTNIEILAKEVMAFNSANPTDASK